MYKKKPVTTTQKIKSKHTMNAVQFTSKHQIRLDVLKYR